MKLVINCYPRQSFFLRHSPDHRSIPKILSNYPNTSQCFRQVITILPYKVGECSHQHHQKHKYCSFTSLRRAWSIVMSMSVCLSVWTTQKPNGQTSPNFCVCVCVYLYTTGAGLSYDYNVNRKWRTVWQMTIKMQMFLPTVCTKNLISQISTHLNPQKSSKPNPIQPNPWMDPTHVQLWS